MNQERYNRIFTNYSAYLRETIERNGPDLEVCFSIDRKPFRVFRHNEAPSFDNYVSLGVHSGKKVLIADHESRWMFIVILPAPTISYNQNNDESSVRRRLV